MQLWALIVDSFRESLDRKIFWVLIVISMLVAAAMFCIGFAPTHVDLMFGMWEIETVRYNPETAIGRGNIASIAVGIADLALGVIGLTLMIVATANFFTAFIEGGAIDVVLSKPISRAKLFLGKYIASMVFVLLQAAFFGVVTFLVMGLRWGTWLPNYLLIIPLLVILFSYIYCISVWAAVTTRSVIAAIFVAMGAWFMFFCVQAADDSMTLYPTLKEHRTVYNTVRTLRWVFPKTQDIAYLVERWTEAGSAADLIPETAQQDEEMMKRAREVEAERRAVNPVHTIGTSLAFEAVIVMLAMWSFSRKDY